MITTHGAHVFLGDHDVYKIKRALSYSYLDMSTLEARQHLCERELALNKPALPDIYLDVVPITREDDGCLAVQGKGAVVEWALHMRRFSEELVLDNLAKRHQLDKDLATRMGRAIAEYHAGLPAEAVHDGYARIHEVVHELVFELDRFEPLFSREILDRFKRDGVQELSACKQLLDQRAQDGFVRRCHGDLHLRNMVLHNGVPVPFDALEFDERMATTDVLYDIAFLLMDLDYRELLPQANATFNHYILYSDENTIQALRLLPLFLFCRAGIRAMTTAQALPNPEDTQSKASREAQRYLALALQYLNRTDPVLIAIGGVSGSGKSTQAALLAPYLGNPPGAVLFRSDVERKHSLGLELDSELPPGHYTQEHSRQNYAHLLQRSSAALDAGMPVIVDAVFLEQEQRKAMEQLALRKGIRFEGLWLEAATDRLEQRISSRQNDASDATVSVMQKQLQKGPGELSWKRIPGNGTTEQVRQLVQQACTGPETVQA